MVKENRLMKVERELVTVSAADLPEEVRKALVFDPGKYVPEEDRLALTRQHLGGHTSSAFDRLHLYDDAGKASLVPMNVDMAAELEKHGTVVVPWEAVDEMLVTPSNVVAYLGTEKRVEAVALSPLMVVEGTVLAQQGMVHPGVSATLEYMLENLGNLKGAVDGLTDELRVKRVAEEEKRRQREAYLKWLREDPVVAVKTLQGNVVLGKYGEYGLPNNMRTTVHAGNPQGAVQPATQADLHTLLNAAKAEGKPLHLAGRPKDGRFEVSAVLLPDSYTPRAFMYRLTTKGGKGR